MIRILLFTCVLLAGSISSATEDFALNDLDGVEHRVSDYRGKWIAINFWATWCPPCVHEMPDLQNFYDLSQDTATVWGVTFEDTDRELIKEFVADLGVTYPILGMGMQPITPYGQVRVLPTTFLIDPEGKFFKRFEGPITAPDLDAAIRSASAQ